MRSIMHIVAGLMAILVTVSTTGQEPFCHECKKYPDSDNLSEKLFMEFSNLSTKYSSKGDLHGIESCFEIMSNLNHYNLEINNGLIKVQLGILDYYSNNNITALSNYLWSLKIFTNTGYTEGIVALLNNVAIIFARVDDYEMTIKYLNKALDYTTEENFSTRSLILLNIAEIETFLGHFDVSLEIAKQLYEEYDSDEVEFALISIVGVIIRNYNKLGEYESALGWINSVTDTMFINAGPVGLHSYCPNAMETYYNLNNYDKVLELGEMIYPPENTDFLPDLYDALDILSIVSQEKDEYNLATEYEELLREIEFSRTSINREELIDLLMTDYAFSLDNIARSNLEREIYLNNEKHSSLNMFIIIFLVVIASVSIFTLFVLRLRKIRQILKKSLAGENSKLAQINRDLSASNRVREKENALLDTLISVFAHDLINPFQAILGFSRLMISDYDNIEEESIKEYTSMLSDTSFQLSQLLINLRNMAVLQDENRHLESVLFPIDPIISDIITLFTPAARKKNVLIDFRSKGGLNAYFNPDIFQSVIRNVLSNAVKFSHQHGIIEIDSTDSDGSTVIRIQDHGTGMTEETLNKLVSREFLKSSPGTLHEKGSGLGLTICIELLELYKGKLQIESKIGVGSLLTIYIPNNHE